METKEKRNDERTCADDSCSAMSKCMRGCRWFPIIPVVLGMALFLLGYYLSPEITRILWMIIAGFVVLTGTFGLLMMSKMNKTCCG